MTTREGKNAATSDGSYTAEPIGCDEMVADNN
jgi:hypothetical protein